MSAAWKPGAKMLRNCYNADFALLPFVDMRISTLQLAFPAALLSSLLLGAESTPTIGKILADPQDYHAHLVTLKGAIRDLQEGPSPIVSENGLCYGASYFTIQDGTGSIPIEFAGVCGRGPEGDPHLSVGNQVTVHGTIMWDHQYPGNVHAIAMKVTN